MAAPDAGRRIQEIDFAAIGIAHRSVHRHSGLPIPVTWGDVSPQSQVLQKDSGPVLICPSAVVKAAGCTHADRSNAAWQTTHQRTRAVLIEYRTCRVSKTGSIDGPRSFHRL